MGRLEANIGGVPMGIGLLGIGAAVPPTVRTNDFWSGALASPRNGALELDEAGQRADFLVIDRQTDGTGRGLAPEILEAMREIGDPVFQGARTRHVISDDEEISDLEARAGLQAIEDAGLTPEDINLVLVHSLPTDLLIPSNAPAVQAKCGLVNASAWNLDVGCASLQPQLATAAALVASHMMRHVLIVQSQCATRVIDPESRQAIGFGDAAAAAVVGVVPEGRGLLGAHFLTDGSFRDGIVLAPVERGSPQRRWWRSSAPPRMSTFDADVGKLAGQRGPSFCREACLAALADAGLTLDDVALFIGNQSVGWFFGACRRALGLPKERGFETFSEFGNIGGATVLFNLREARRRSLVRDGDVILLYSPAAGFTRAAAVVRWWERRAQHA